MPETASQAQPLLVRLEPRPAPPPAAPPRAAAPRPAATPQRIAALPRQLTAAAQATAPVVLPEESAIQTDAGVPASPAAVSEPAVVANAAPTVFRMPETPPAPSFPRNGRITYQLTLGAEHTPVGRTVQTWEFEGTHYKLGSLSESTGLIEMIRPHRYRYLSQGTVSDQGLRPDRFLASVKRGNRSEESLAEFNWETGEVRLGRVPQQATVALPAGSQDIISFMYHLALAPPPPGRIRMPFTRGRQLEITSFDVLPEESVDTPLGRLRAIPVVQARESGQESLAIWLATEYRNLPIRIRFYGRDGELSGEQLVSAIQVSER